MPKNVQVCRYLSTTDHLNLIFENLYATIGLSMSLIMIEFMALYSN